MTDLLSNIGSTITEKPFLAYVGVFLGGVLVSLTPCVYPVIPITFSYIGGNSQGSRFKGFLLSIVYVLGMSLTYAALGAFAALSGRLFGQISASPWVNFLVGVVCILMGLSMFDVFTLPPISFLNSFQPRKDTAKGGYGGAFLIGVFSGFVVGPCTAPALGALLVYVGSKQNVIYGTTLLFVFALGIGLLLVCVGTFAGLLSNLPKSGAWLLRIKKIFGWLLLIIGEYFIYLMGKYSV